MELSVFITSNCITFILILTLYLIIVAGHFLAAEKSVSEFQYYTPVLNLVLSPCYNQCRRKELGRWESPSLLGISPQMFRLSRLIVENPPTFLYSKDKFSLGKQMQVLTLVLPAVGWVFRMCVLTLRTLAILLHCPLVN